MRLLVVDDEKIVQDSIRLIIKREGLKFVDMDVASTGKEAIDKSMSFRPDVVFMDINMPGLSGIDAMKSIAALYPSTLFAVITAYDVFEYARESLKVGACDYIVKPFTPSRIVEAITSLNARVVKREAEIKELLRLKECVNELAAFADDGAIGLMISGGDMCALLSRYGRRIPEQGGKIALIVSRGSQPKVETALLELKRQYPGIICQSFVNGRAAMFIPAGLETAELRNKIAEHVGEESFIFVCGDSAPRDSLFISYGQAVNELAAAAPAPSVTRQSLFELCRYAACCPEDELEQGVSMLFSCASAGRSFEEALKAMASSLLVCAQIILEGEAVSSRISEVASAGFAGVLDCADERRLLIASRAFLSRLKKESGCKSENRYVRETVRYIDENFSMDISLESAAANISVSPGSLGRILREELQKSFTELLMEKRIERACAMIREGSLSVKEICFEVGYNDPNYFSRVFKKTTGLSPSQFKEKLTEEVR